MLRILCLILLPQLVVLTDGRFFKVTHYEHAGHAYTLHLTNGGSVTLPESRVEQIVQDEIHAHLTGPSGTHLTMEWVDPIESRNIPYWNLITTHARDQNLNPLIVAAVARVESNFDFRALSNKGAMGIMQLMPSTCERYGVKNPWDPESNILGGVKFLRDLKKKFDGDATLVFAAYNAGEHTVERYNGPPPFRETEEFINRVSAVVLTYMKQ